MIVRSTIKMYPVSSQRRHWTFQNEQETNELRLKHNQQFQQTHGDRLNINVIWTDNIHNRFRHHLNKRYFLMFIVLIITGH